MWLSSGDCDPEPWIWHSPPAPDHKWAVMWTLFLGQGDAFFAFCQHYPSHNLTPQSYGALDKLQSHGPALEDFSSGGRDPVQIPEGSWSQNRWEPQVLGVEWGWRSVAARGQDELGSKDFRDVGIMWLHMSERNAKKITSCVTWVCASWLQMSRGLIHSEELRTLVLCR